MNFSQNKKLFLFLTGAALAIVLVIIVPRGTQAAFSKVANPTDTEATGLPKDRHMIMLNNAIVSVHMENYSEGQQYGTLRFRKSTDGLTWTEALSNSSEVLTSGMNFFLAKNMTGNPNCSTASDCNLYIIYFRDNSGSGCCGVPDGCNGGDSGNVYFRELTYDNNAGLWKLQPEMTITDSANWWDKYFSWSIRVSGDYCAYKPPQSAAEPKPQIWVEGNRAMILYDIQTPERGGGDSEAGYTYLRTKTMTRGVNGTWVIDANSAKDVGAMKNCIKYNWSTPNNFEPNAFVYAALVKNPLSGNFAVVVNRTIAGWGGCGLSASAYDLGGSRLFIEGGGNPPPGYGSDPGGSEQVPFPGASSVPLQYIENTYTGFNDSTGAAGWNCGRDAGAIGTIVDVSHMCNKTMLDNEQYPGPNLSVTVNNLTQSKKAIRVAYSRYDYDLAYHNQISRRLYMKEWRQTDINTFNWAARQDLSTLAEFPDQYLITPMTSSADDDFWVVAQARGDAGSICTGGGNCGGYNHDCKGSSGICVGDDKIIYRRMSFDASDPLPANWKDVPVYPTAGIGVVDSTNGADRTPTAPADQPASYLTTAGHPAFIWSNGNASPFTLSYPEDGSPIRVNGWGWSPAIGWVSLDYLNMGKFGDPRYGVLINTATNKVSGEMWSPNVGWITFNYTPATDCTDPAPEGGALDPSFGQGGIIDEPPTTTYSVEAATVIDENYIYVVGEDETHAKWRIEKRRLADGTLVNSFGKDNNGVIKGGDNSDYIKDVAIDHEFMYIVGDGYSDTGDHHWLIEKRRLSDGSLDTAFDGDGILVSSTPSTNTAFSIAIDSTYMYVVGDDGWNIEKRRLDDGTLVTAFDGDGVITEAISQTPYGIAIDGTYMYVIGSGWRIEKRRLDTGALVTNFDGNGIVEPVAGREANSLAIDTNLNALYVVGKVIGSSTYDWRIEKRSLTTGALCTAANCSGTEFGTGGVVTSAGDQYEASSIATDGVYMYVTGNINNPGTHFRVEKYRLTDGAPDSTFGNPPAPGGFVNSDNNSKYPNGITVDGAFIYIVGNHQGDGWRIEKRFKEDQDPRCNPNSPDPSYPFPAAGTIAKFNPDTNSLVGWARVMSTKEEGEKLDGSFVDGQVDKDCYPAVAGVNACEWGWVRLGGTWTNNKSTLLNVQNLNIGDLIAHVVSTVGFPVASSLLIEPGANQETIAYSTKDATSFTLSTAATKSHLLTTVPAPSVRLATQSGSYSTGMQYLGDKGAYELFDFAYSQQFGWIQFLPFRFLGFPYVQTKAGDIYGQGNITIPAPPTATNQQYTATYLIQAGGTIAPFISSAGGYGPGASSQGGVDNPPAGGSLTYLQPNVGTYGYPGITSQYQNALGKLDLDKITRVVSGCKVADVNGNLTPVVSPLSCDNMDGQGHGINDPTCYTYVQPPGTYDPSKNWCSNDGNGLNAYGAEVVIRHTNDGSRVDHFSGLHPLLLSNDISLDGKAYYYPNAILSVSYSHTIKNGATSGAGIVVSKGVSFRESGVNAGISYDSTAPATIKQLASALWITTTDDVNVYSTVTNLAGSFITGINDTTSTKGIFNTCYLPADSSACGKNQLKVQGVVLARKFNLNRTWFGPAGTQSVTDPSELFTNDGRLLANPPNGVQDLSQSLPKFQQVRP